MDNKIIINPVDSQTFELQEYSVSQSALIQTDIVDTAFTSSTDYIECFIYDGNKNLVTSAVPFTDYSIIEGDVILKPADNLERLGLDDGEYFINYSFYRRRLASTPNNVYYIKEISSDRTEIRLDTTSPNLDNELIISSSLEFIQFRDDNEFFIDFKLNFGNNNDVIANNIELDLSVEDDPTILIKLYEPLPASYDLNSTCYVTQEVSAPQTYNVVFPPQIYNPDDFVYLSGPNFSLNVKGQAGTPGMDMSYSTLAGSDITSSFNQVNNLLNKKEIEISVNYEDYNDFVYFSSAHTRLQNFYYKAGLIQSASAQLGSISSSTTGSSAYSSSQASLNSIIETTIKNFDGYEYFLYFNSGSRFSYPKSNSSPPYNLVDTGSATALNWLGSSDVSSAYYGGQALSASNYDADNQNALFFAIPEYLRNDPQNAKYELFVDMVGQHYDNIWVYTKNITTKFDADNRLDYGISKDMVADAVRDFGVKLYSNNFNTDDLYLAFLGLTPSGSTFPVTNITGSTPVLTTGSEYVDTKISASNEIIPLDDANKRIYKRIYHNIPYLLKTKGTIAGLRALITSYGIPDTILRINEFGGKDRIHSQDWDLKQDQYNRAFKTETSQINTKWELNSTWGSVSNRPGAVQFRFKTEGIPSGSSVPNTQSIFYTDAASKVAMSLDYDPSLLVSGSYSGSIPSNYKEYGTLRFWPNADINPSNTASLYLPFWDAGWWSVQVNRSTATNEFTLLAANKIGENLGFTGSDTISADLGKWNASNNIYWFTGSILDLGSNTYFPFSGSAQEIRYYTEPISQSNFYDFTLNPYSYEGNGVGNTPNQLAFRLPLGTMLLTSSLAVSSSIHPRITGSLPTTSSFPSNSNKATFTKTLGFEDNVEDIYLDQTPSGMRNRVTDKTQVENLILPEGDTLSAYRSIQQQSFVSESYTPSVNYLEVAFSPQNQINDDIIGSLGYFNIGEYIGDPRFISSSATSYPSLDILRDAYFEKYISNYDLTDFIRLIKFFDNSLFKMIEDFTPARTSLSSGVVIKQHLLERNRQRPAIVTSSFEQYSGSVTNLPKDYSTGSTDYPQYSFSGSSIYVFNGGTAGSFEPFNGLQTYPSGTLNLGPDNRFFLTQSWSESYTSISGSFPLPRVDQREFYNGEFSGSLITASIKDICSAYFKPSKNNYSYVPAFWSADGNNGTGTISLDNFLSPTNQPPAGYAWFWNDGLQGTVPNAVGNVLYIKLSLETRNGLNILNFIQGVDFITFNLNTPLDINGSILNGPQTYYIESVAIQPESLSTSADSVGSALCFTVPEISSTAIVSADASFYDFTLVATGDYQWHATEDTTADPNPVLNTGISASVPQAYFPLTSTYPTESFFRGWASSNFYTNGTFNSFNGILNDPLNNFNTGSKEIDNSIQTGLVRDYVYNQNYPWFMNAHLDSENQSWIRIPSESFLDYANIPDSTAGPVATNNYFNIAWTSASSAENPAIQGINYYYNSSNNAIYISGSEFQNEIKEPNALYSSSNVVQLLGTDSGITTYTPPGQTSLDISIAPHNELWLYRGDADPFAGILDGDYWAYNRYKHRAFKIYYVTNTGSGEQGFPYSLYDPMVFEPLVVVTEPNANLTPEYYDSNQRKFITMLGTTGNTTAQRNYYRPLNSGPSWPATTEVSGSFNIFSQNRQVKPFIFTTYRDTVAGVTSTRLGSGSFVNISQSDGTPFARLQMFQAETINPGGPGASFGTFFTFTCLAVAPLEDCFIRYYNEDGVVTPASPQIITVNNGEEFHFCGDSSRSTGNVLQFESGGQGEVTLGVGNSDNPCPAAPPPRGANNYRNETPYFFDMQTANNSIFISNLASAFNPNIPYGEHPNADGANTSSLGLINGTTPFGSDQQPDLVFPSGSYIFTMSAFDTNQFTNGTTEFGLWTRYGDYVEYEFQNQVGSGVEPAVINYTDANQNETSVNVFTAALTLFDGNFDTAPNDNGGSGASDAINYNPQSMSSLNSPGSPAVRYARFNVTAAGDFFVTLQKSAGSMNAQVYIGSDQTATGNSIAGMSFIGGLSFGSNLGPQTFSTTVTNSQQILIRFEKTTTGTGLAYVTDFYVDIPSPNVIAEIATPTKVSGTDPYVVTGSVISNYASGVPLPTRFATKVEDAYLVYSSSASSSLGGAYIFDVVPTFGQIFITASVIVSSFTDAQAALYGNAIYGSSEYGGGNTGGGTTWTTASLILYSGSANNFPNEMPQIGGDIFAITSSNSLTHNAGERITLMTSLQASDIEYNKALKLALRVGSGSNAASVVENSLIVTEYSMSFSSSVEIPEDPSIPTVFSDDLNFDKAFDCQPLLNNYSNQRINNRLQDIDYGTNIYIPSNWQQIIEFSASRASVPELYYTSLSSTSNKYLGKTSTSNQINVWSPGDIGTYGKLPTVEVARGFLGYFNRSSDLYPVLNGHTLYNIQYLIGENGQALQPKLSDISLYNMQGTYDSYPLQSRGIVSINNPDFEIINELNGLRSFAQVTKKPVPVIYTQQSGLFPVSASVGIEMIGSEPVDPSIEPNFSNYSVSATGFTAGAQASNISSQVFEAPQKTPQTNADPNVTASFVDGGVTRVVYDTNTGILTIPNTDIYPSNNEGNGNPTSQPYALNFSIGIDTTPLTYPIQSSNTNKHGNFNTNSNVGDLRIKIERTTSGGPTSTSFTSFLPSSYQVTLTNFFASAAGGTIATQLDFGSFASSAINASSNGGIQIIFNSNTIEQAVAATGQSAQAVQNGGTLLKQRWTISGTVPPSFIKQGRRFRIKGDGDMITTTGGDPSKDPKFFPTAQGGGIEYEMDLDGANSNPVTAATASFFEFKDSGSIDPKFNRLVCVSTQLNKAYGRGFIQKDLVYTSSANKDYPEGKEPGFTSFPTITTPWSVQPYDEIRFLNDEDQTYKILEVVEPAQQQSASLIVDGVGSLELLLDREVPASFDNIRAYAAGKGVALDLLATSSQAIFSDTGDVTTVVGSDSTPKLVEVEYSASVYRPLDFFVIRRYVDDASALVVEQQYPQTNPPTTSSVTGIITPEYPIASLKTNPDEVLSDLIDKKLIE